MRATLLPFRERAAFAEKRPGRCLYANVLGVKVDSVNMDSALARVAELLRRHEKGYVCAASVHGVLKARRNRTVAEAFAGAAMVIPDGRPMVWAGRMQGCAAMEQVTGPDLMAQVFARREFAGYSHFFYGGKEGIAEELAGRWKRQFPGTRVAGTFTPPFRELSLAEESEVIRLINRRRPDIVWVGISAPRQEVLMRRLIPHLHHGVLFGVGAAFDFHTGRIRDCAPWMKRAGLQWLHRLMQDPRRLWRRNLFNATFPWHFALQLAGVKPYYDRFAEDAGQRASAGSKSSPLESA